MSSERSCPPFRAVEEIYTGKKSGAVLPHVTGIAMREVKTDATGTWATVEFVVKDPESKPLDISFAYLNHNAPQPP